MTGKDGIWRNIKQEQGQRTKLQTFIRALAHKSAKTDPQAGQMGARNLKEAVLEARGSDGNP